MNIDLMTQSTYSIRQALGIAVMRQAMHQDPQSVAVLLSDMKNVNAKVMENAVSPHKGGNIDISI
ncbi:MAG: putative motility protein [Firmicutes bacterium]|nr:putative motility protein [Bacillota bacterium]